MDLNARHLQLVTLLKQIDEQLTKFLPRISVPTADSSSYASLMTRLDAWQGQLRLILRDISSAEHRARMEMDSARDLPRGDARYRAMQSAQGRLSQLHDLQQSASAVALRLVELLDRISDPTWPERVNASAKVIGDGINSAKEMRDATQHLRALVAVARKGTAIDNVPTQASNVDLFVTLALVGRLMQMAALGVPQFAMRATKNVLSGVMGR